jgi:glycosyltransferase involved in cell wall biosynthesis
VTAPIIAVNGRFLTMTPTGVQRYGREILERLASHAASRLVVLVPPNRVLEIANTNQALLNIGVTGQWHGARGHAWEQFALPRLVRRVGADVLWSPCSWGPIATRRQVLVVHDIAPLTHPEFFTRPYRSAARLLTSPLVRRTKLVVTPSTRVRNELTERFELAEDRVIVVPPGVGRPFDTWPLDDLAERAGGYCVLVGAHDERKNADFLLQLWPEVYARTGLKLVLTRRSNVTARVASETADVPGVVTHVDPTDSELARLYAGALCLVWPSHYEGYGFPLLEAMAVGTPFLSTDVGAAAELAVEPDVQVLPLDPASWIEQIERWHVEGLGSLRSASAERARRLTWETAAEATAALLDGYAR